MLPFGKPEGALSLVKRTIIVDVYPRCIAFVK